MNPINISGITTYNNYARLTNSGSAPNYTGYPGTITNTGEVGIGIYNSDDYHIQSGTFTNINGTGVDIQRTAGSWQHVSSLSNIRTKHCYYGFRLHNYAEYETLESCWASNCAYGIVVESGSHSIDNFKATFCSFGVKIDGSAAQNDSHGTWANLISNHCTYNLSCVNVTAGEVFNSCCFIAGQSGGYDAGGGIQLINSKGIVISGSQIAYLDINVDATSVLSLVGCVFRGTVAITVTSGGTLNAKSNIVMAGATLTLNGAGFSGNN